MDLFLWEWEFCEGPHCQWSRPLFSLLGFTQPLWSCPLWVLAGHLWEYSSLFGFLFLKAQGKRVWEAVKPWCCPWLSYLFRRNSSHENSVRLRILVLPFRETASGDFGHQGGRNNFVLVATGWPFIPEALTLNLIDGKLKSSSLGLSLSPSSPPLFNCQLGGELFWNGATETDLSPDICLHRHGPG